MIESLINKIHFADCLDVLRQSPDGSVDLMLTDPPYNTTNCDWDTAINFFELWNEWNRVIKNDGAILVFASQPFTTDLIQSNRKYFRYELILDKMRSAGFLNANRMPLKTHENICVFYRSLPTYNPQKTIGPKYDKTKGNGEIRDKKLLGAYVTKNKKNDGERFPVSIMTFSQNWARQGQEHPTQKPVDLFRYLIKTYSNPGDVVFDGYGGSGTTAIAAQMENRKFIVCENHFPYFEASQKRLEDLMSAPYLFQEC